MQLYASSNIQIMYIITFVDSLLEVLQGFPTLKQIVSLNIGVKCNINAYNKGHLMWKSHTRGYIMKSMWT